MSDSPPTGINDGGETPRVHLPKVRDPSGSTFAEWTGRCCADRS
jgi:hypothetical protein